MTIRSLADFSEAELLTYLGKIDAHAEIDAVQADAQSASQDDQSLHLPIPYLWKAHDVGFVPVFSARKKFAPIISPSNLAKEQLISPQAQLDILVDRIHAHWYPGSWGTGLITHHVVFALEAQHSVSSKTMDVAYLKHFEFQGKASPAQLGSAMLLGLIPDARGLIIKANITPVYNREYRDLLSVLDSEPSSLGVELLSMVQPALAPLVSCVKLALSLLTTEGGEATVQSFEIRLDYDVGHAGYRLAPGSYIFAQVPKNGAIMWSDWEFEVASNRIVSGQEVNGERKELPFNYVMLRIVEHSA